MLGLFFRPLLDDAGSGWAALHRDPGMITDQLNEFMAVRTSVHGWLKDVAEPVEIGGHLFNAGDRILLLLGSANRDPGRGNRPSLTFSAGPHTCLGRNWARELVEVAVRHVLATVPRASLVSAVPQTNLSNNGFRALTVLVEDGDVGPRNACVVDVGMPGGVVVDIDDRGQLPSYGGLARKP
jgi:cytochrome P450